MRGIEKRAFLLGAVLILLLLSGGCFLFAPPEPPTDVSASDGEYVDHVLVRWSAARRASRYEVFRATEEDGDYEKIGETPALRFTDETASPNVLYWYRVRACNQFGCSAFSPADSGFRYGQKPPAPPQNVQASDGTYTDRIRITWSPSLGATYYEIHRSDIPGADYIGIAQTSATFYEDREIVRGRVYWYRVKACNPYGCSDPSEPDSGSAALQLPGAPQNVQASDGTYSDRVRITWSAVSGAARYEVWRALTREGEYELLRNVTATSYDDTQVTAGTVYWYKVRAWNALGYGPFSEPDSGYASAAGGGGGGALPGQVQNVQASDGTYLDRIRVTWSPVSGATYYEVWRSDSGVEGTFSLLASNLTSTTYDDTTQTVPCTVKWYRVRACNAQGCGPASVADSGYPGGALAQVTGLKATTVQTPSFQVTLTWDAVPNAQTLGVRYEVWRTEPGVAWRPIAQTESTTFTETLNWSTSPAGTTYTYKVRAVSTYGCIPPGSFSAEVSVTVPRDPAQPLALPGRREEDAR